MYKFKFIITNLETDEETASDWTIFNPEDIDQFGAVETIDNHTGAVLRYLRRQHAKSA